MSASHEFRLFLNVDNSAFGETKEDQAQEIARILRETAERVTNDPGMLPWFQTVRDINGNDIGRFAIKPDNYK